MAAAEESDEPSGEEGDVEGDHDGRKRVEAARGQWESEADVHRLQRFPPEKEEVRGRAAEGPPDREAGTVQHAEGCDATLEAAAPLPGAGVTTGPGPED